jgi:hypothetical protein
MLNKWELMLRYSDGELESELAHEIKKSIDCDPDLKKGYLLNKQIDDFMRLYLMMEDAASDPELQEIQKSMKPNHVLEEFKDDGIKFYIKGAMDSSNKIEKLLDESEKELRLQGIENEVFSWTESFMYEKEKKLLTSKYDTEILSYIRKGMGQDQEKMVSGSGNRKKLLYRISAVAAVLILAVFLHGLFGKNPEPAEMYALYYKPYHVTDGQTRNNETDEENYAEIIKIYRSANYGQTISLLDKLTENQNIPPKISLIYGISLMETDKEQNAIGVFNKLIAEGGEYNMEAKWYLALCYLKMEETEKSKELFMQLSKTPGLYKKLSEDILKSF